MMTLLRIPHLMLSMTTGKKVNPSVLATFLLIPLYPCKYLLLQYIISSLLLPYSDSILVTQNEGPSQLVSIVYEESPQGPCLPSLPDDFNGSEWLQ